MRVAVDKKISDIPFTWKGLFRGWWVTSRMEYAPSAINEVGIPALLALFFRSADTDFYIAVIAGLAVWWIGEFVGSSMNCLADYETDRLDSLNKSRITRAIDGIGLQRLYWVNFIEIIVNTLLVLLLILWKGRPLLIVFWLVGLAFSTAYSYEPAKFKRRGLLNAFTLDTILYICPMFFVFHLLSSEFHSEAVWVIAVFCLQMIPMFFVDEISDYEEDRETGMTNPCVLWGRVKTSLAAFAVYLVSSAMMVIVVFYYWSPSTSLQFVFYGLMLLAFAKVLLDFWGLRQTSQKIEKADRKTDMTALLKQIKSQVKTPLWLMLTGIGVWFALIANLI